MAVKLKAKWTCSSSSIGYVTSGLILNVDGICNTRNGHSDNLSSWQDLSGNNIDTSGLYNVTVNSDNIELAGNNTSYAIFNSNTIKSAIDNANYTISTTIYLPSTFTETYKAIVMAGGSYANSKMVLIFAYGGTDSATMTKCYNYSIAFWGNDTNYNFDQSYCDKKARLDYVYQSGIERIYLNGVLKASGSHSKMTLYDNRFILGVYDNTGTNQRPWEYSFDGKFYSVQVYNRALSQSEITQNYNIDKARFNL